MKSLYLILGFFIAVSCVSTSARINIPIYYPTSISSGNVKHIINLMWTSKVEPEIKAKFPEMYSVQNQAGTIYISERRFQAIGGPQKIDKTNFFIVIQYRNDVISNSYALSAISLASDILSNELMLFSLTNK